MKIVNPNFSFIGALFAMTMDIAQAFSWFVSIITLGWVGKEWPLNIAYYSLGHKWNVVYDSNYEEQKVEE